MKHTLEFLYMNGKKWKSTNVRSVSCEERYVNYTRKNKSTGITESFSVPTTDVVAVRETLKDGTGADVHTEVYKNRAFNKLSKAANF